jgi:AraC-like DNA-binding protein
MIEQPASPRKHDRLTAFLEAFGLRAGGGRADCESPAARLYVLADDDGHAPARIVFRARGGLPVQGCQGLLAEAGIDFGGIDNPLVGALPEELVFRLEGEPQLRGLSDLFVAEVENSRCGGRTIKDRLCEVIVVLAIRRAIAIGTVDAGLLAGLAHPKLHASLVAMHDDPARHWRIAALADIAGMSRSHFVAEFSKTVGEAPASYLTSWRLALGRAEMAAGHSVKTVAARVGFGSPAAFSRAFSRKYGHPPARMKKAGGPEI